MELSSRRWDAVGVAWLALTGCAATAAPGAAPVGGTLPAAAARSSEPELRALTPSERALEQELRAEVRALVALGERSPRRPWELAGAADALAEKIEAAGYPLERQGYELQGVLAQNLVASLRGSARPEESVVVGAHYDCPEGSPGASDATGAAALLVLARRLRAAAPAVSVHWVWFGTSAPPYARTASQGSQRYVRRALERAERVRAAVLLGGLGSFSSALGSQRPWGPAQPPLPTAARFVAVLADERAGALGETVAAGLTRHGALPVERLRAPADTPALGGSDAWGFVEQRWPAVTLTDTAELRDAARGTAEDTAERVDYARLALVTLALEAVVRELAEVPAAAAQGSAPALP